MGSGMNVPYSTTGVAPTSSYVGGGGGVPPTQGGYAGAGRGMQPRQMQPYSSGQGQSGTCVIKSVTCVFSLKN
jgi:hypothetical protein